MHQSSQNGTIVCSVNFGRLPVAGKDFDGFIGVDDIIDCRSILFFFNSEDQVIGHAMSTDDNKVIVANCEPTNPKSSLLYEIIPEFVNDLSKLVLLGSIGIDRIDEEGIDYEVFQVDNNPSLSTKPFFIGDDFFLKGSTPAFLCIQKVFGTFIFNRGANAVFPIKKFLSAQLKVPKTLTWDCLGEIADYDTDSETSCLMQMMDK